MRVPLLAFLPFALGTLASLANAHFTDDIEAREIHDDALTFARRSFHDHSALEQRDIIASLSTRDRIDGLNRRTSWHCGTCDTFLYTTADVICIGVSRTRIWCSMLGVWCLVLGALGAVDRVVIHDFKCDYILVSGILGGHWVIDADSAGLRRRL
ncbi:hypothetical protein DFP72DRAFT_856806 [Ephemerocybe angulata]|uniref:Uncharacterized protein n=1 Tax=Ephemerocybe angulata TaxID=980116 RepID=A0A8H6LV67_9AGAR|nr:hypothetical protein DFP72DRAFT_856806 [Tulosesus angulatus]